MEGKLLKEISYLTRLIEQHEKNSTARKVNNIADDKKSLGMNGSIPTHNVQRFSTEEPAYRTQRQSHNKYSYVKPQPPGKVHVNPNFKPKNPGIHVNPKIATKPSVHINPKMMKDFGIRKSLEKHSRHVMDMKEDSGRSIVQTKIEPSVYVNPKLMKELSATKQKQYNIAKVETTKPENKYAVHSRTKLVRSATVPNSVTKKLTNPNLISLSHRKLVRIRRNSKGASGISPTNPGRVRRLSNSGPRKTKIATKYKLVMENFSRPACAISIPRSAKNIAKSGSNKYKIDRTQVQRVKKRLSIGKNDTNTNATKSPGSSMGLVRIGGILYKSSRNQLVRSSNEPSPSKKKRCIINVKGDRFVMANNGKKLRRLCSSGDSPGNLTRGPVSRVDIGGMTFVEKTPNVLVRLHTKNNISNKVKQRSIQILRNKMRKNNQPCLIFQKFGYCAGQVKGTCPKLHDKKQVALCRNFLQGKCLLDDCPMSHAVGPEKMPTCKYFLEGCCIRDPCPYLHVKVSPNTPICTQFLRGYCAEAHKCKQRHVYVCPEFDKTGKCAKGKYCPYPHKPRPSAPKKYRVAPQRKHNVQEKLMVNPLAVDTLLPQSEDRKRYYDEAGLEEDLVGKRESILEKIEIMKGVHIAELGGPGTGTSNEVRENSIGLKENETKAIENESDSENERPRRPPIGPLPSYISIN